MIEIRKMSELDLEAVYTIETQCFKTPWSYDSLASELKNTLAVYYVLIESGTVAGYAGMWTIIDELHITNVAVAPEYRGKGYGVRLMAALIGFGKDAGFAHMTLEVRTSNTTAISLYEKFDFVSVGTRPGYYTDTGEDACIMWKEL